MIRDGTDWVTTCNTACGLSVLHAVKWGGRVAGRDTVCDRVSGLGRDTRDWVQTGRLGCDP